jgi:hypothetical protein
VLTPGASGEIMEKRRKMKQFLLKILRDSLDMTLKRYAMNLVLVNSIMAAGVMLRLIPAPTHHRSSIRIMMGRSTRQNSRQEHTTGGLQHVVILVDASDRWRSD